jgi:NAD(P)-dependent dehydrogenase (short-subunit alcohol dehydrogenase family)
VLVANAGLSGPSLQGLAADAPIEDVAGHMLGWTTESFNETFAINTTGVFFTAASFLTLLDAGNKNGGLKQKSQIIVTSSIGGFNRNPLVGFAYGGSKAALTHITKQLSTFLGPYRIRANIIAPGCE